jgi:hypothetical protein
MKRYFCMILFVMTVLSLAFAVPAFAAKDVIYPSNATATVEGSNTTPTNNFSVGADGATTINADVYAGDAVSVTATWSIKNNSGSGTNTAYSRIVQYITSTSQTPGPTVSIASIANCTVSSASSTCSTVISFSAPTTIGNYQIQVTADDTVTGSGSNVAILGRVLSINFSVAEEAAEKLDTKLTVAKKCFLLNKGDVDLTAILQELVTSDSIANADIDFYINPQLDSNGVPTVPSIGTATTQTDGVATLTYNINGLGVGDYNLYAEFNGDENYNPSNDSDILGISYMFVGFRQPINADGTSVFGTGRVIPIKIKIADANGQPVVDATPTVWVTQVSPTTALGTDLEPATSVSAADSGNTMRYVPEDDQYIYNWDLSALTNGTWYVVVDLGDSDACSQGPYYATITVNKKGGKK